MLLQKIQLQSSLFFITGAIFLLLAFISCSNSFSGKPDVGNTHIPTSGIPYFSATVSSNVKETGQTQAFIFLSILENSLIFKNQQDSLINRLSINVSFLDNNGKAVISKNYQLLIGKSADVSYYEQRAYYREFTYPVAPGAYDVNISITDLHSGKQAELNKSLTVPNPNLKEFHISEISLFTKATKKSNYYAVNDYNINAGFDSLTFSFQVTQGPKPVKLELNSTLYRIKADQMPARDMSGKNFRPSSLVYKGLDYTKKTAIQSINRTLSGTGSVTIDNSFSTLEQGNYRFEASLKTPSGKTTFKVREFAIKSPNFPQLKTPRELALPLYYLMKRDTYNHLLAITDEDSLKKTIDSFWIKNIRNATKAREIIELYYDRVEQANIQFSNYKEGWKTDRGMIYILFGPPLYIDDGFGESTWIYEFDSGNQIPHIKFNDTRYGNIKFPFENYLLERTPNLFSLQYRQIQAWTDGSILYLSQ